MKVFDLIVIGGGSAGLVVAAGAAHLGARVALVERKALGGDCLYTGCVPSKTLIRSARFAAEARRAVQFGFAPVEPRFGAEGFASITNRVARVIERVGEHDAPERFERWGVEVIFGEPRFLSPNELEIDDKKHAHRSVIRAKRFCVATGSRPAVPPVEGLKETGYRTNEEVFLLKELPRSLVVLGGGPIGLEMGQSFARFGSEVTIVEMADRLLPKEDREASAHIKETLEGEGIKVTLDTKAISAKINHGQKQIKIEAGGSTRELRAEAIFVATGRRPNVEGLNLEAAGVRYDDKRIITDEYLRTSAKHIFAAGDVTGHYPFTHMAAYEGSIVVRNSLLFRPLMARTDFRVVPWTTFTDPEVARVGLTETQAHERFGEGKLKIYRTEFAENDRAQTEGEPKGFAKIICAGQRLEIVGAHIVGAHAGEIIHEIVLAMKQHLPLTSIGGLVHVYPTLTQVNQQAGLNAVLEKLSAYKKYLSYYLSWRR